MTDRICAERDCTTILSRFNPDTFCAQHEDRIPGPVVLPSWTSRAACASKGALLEEFFPDEMRQTEPTEPVLARKQKCSFCPVQRACLEWALSEEHQKYRYGIFGMLTGPERKEVARASDPLQAADELIEFQKARWPQLTRRPYPAIRRERSA